MSLRYLQQSPLEATVSVHCSRPEPRHDYFVVMIDHGRRGREAVVDPEITRRAVVARIRNKDYGPIAFIHHVTEDGCEDVTNALLHEAGFYNEPIAPLSPSDHLAAIHDHNRDLLKAAS